MNDGPTNMMDVALQFQERGLNMVPSAGPEKKPCVAWKVFQTKRPTPDQLREWDRRYHPERWGVVTGALSGVVVVDFDGEQGRTWLERWSLNPHVRTGSGGSHVYLRHPGWHVPTMNAKTSRRTWPWPGVDIRADGGFAVLLGRNRNGPYQILRPIEPEPFEVLPADLREFLRGNAPKLQTTTPTAPTPTTAGRVDAERLIRAALENGSSGRNNGGFALAVQARDNGYSEADSWIITEYQRRVPPTNAKGEIEPYTQQEALASWREAFSRLAREPWTAKPNGRPATGSAHTTPIAGADADAEQEPDLLFFYHNDHGNAQRLIALYGAELRYCYDIKKWLVWDGRRWAVDGGGRAERLAKETALEFLTQAMRADKSEAADKAEKFAKASLEQKRIGTMLASAQCELPITPAELDTRAELLNFLNGTLDLRNGELRPHQPEHFITKLVHHTYNPAAKCPLFLEFLGRIMGAGPDASEQELHRADRLIAYLQKAFGYSLTGTTSEKAVFILHGSGNNGKTTLLSTIHKLIEEYAMVLQIESIMVKQENNNSQADLADLRGARFVMTSETEEGQRLAEGKLKRITQGMGKIKGVRKWENPITFAETHKLWMDANHRPDIRGVDAAIWNRLHLVPFNVTIPDDEIDRDLPGKLLAEAEGILAWMVQGAVRWHTEGLGRPPEVSAAGEEWRHDCNQVARFIDDSCIVLATALAKASCLYSAYRKWAEDAGERVESDRKFSQRMLALGYTSKHRETGTVYLGLGFRETRS